VHLLQQIVGATSRRAPRGRGRAARWLAAHPGKADVPYRDVTELRRTADLRDNMESEWFAGVAVGMSASALEVVRPGDWVIDVGANIGIVTGQLCQRVGLSGRVWALEPLPRNVARLHQLQTDNALRQLQVFDVALSASIGTATLRLPQEGHSGWGSFTASWNQAGEVVVATTTLDQLVADQGADQSGLRLVKIDVEGAEFDVLDGGSQTWRDHRPYLYVEFNDPLMRDAGRSSIELLSACADLGYAPVTEVPTGSLDGSVVDLLLAPQNARH
jgi:FkbM family methyltransferase